MKLKLFFILLSFSCFISCSNDDPDNYDFDKSPTIGSIEIDGTVYPYNNILTKATIRDNELRIQIADEKYGVVYHDLIFKVSPSVYPGDITDNIYVISIQKMDISTAYIASGKIQVVKYTGKRITVKFNNVVFKDKKSSNPTTINGELDFHAQNLIN